MYERQPVGRPRYRWSVEVQKALNNLGNGYNDYQECVVEFGAGNRDPIWNTVLPKL